jgi:SAM-dependent methyltransferase
MLKAAQSLLAHPSVYLAFQRSLRADKHRFECLRALDVQAGHTVLDVGCGPAYYLPALPKVTYHGFDTDARYIAYARQHYGHLGSFTCDMYTEESRRNLPSFDRVLLMGLLHHLDDQQATALLALIARSLRPDGIVIALDTCLDPALWPAQRWLATRDRGQHVRETKDFVRLAQQSFSSVSGSLTLEWFVPVRQWVMVMRGPQ